MNTSCLNTAPVNQEEIKVYYAIQNLDPATRTMWRPRTNRSMTRKSATHNMKRTA